MEKINDMLPEERIKYIGASESAAVLGMSRYKTPLQVWAEKTKTIPIEDISDKLPVKLGNRLEEVVAELYTEKTGKKVHRIRESFIHPKYDFIRAHIDRKIDGERKLLECKVTSAFKSREWEGDDVPVEYIIQVYQQLLCSGYDSGDIASLIGNNDFKIKTIFNDEKILADIEKKLVNFWNNYVIPKVMPMQIKAQDSDVLLQMFPQASVGEKIQLSDDVNKICESLEAMKSDKKALENAIAKDENTLKAMLKNADMGESGLYRIKWSNVHKDEYTVKAVDYRKFGYKKISKED